MVRIPRLALALITAAVLSAALPLAGARAAEPDARWGVYGRLAAAGAWLHTLSSGATATARYTWVRPNEELRAEHRLQGADRVTVETITLGPRPGQLTVATRDNDQAEATTSVVELQPNGSAVETFTARNGVHGRATYTMTPENHYSATTEAEVDGQWLEVYSSEARPLKE